MSYAFMCFLVFHVKSHSLKHAKSQIKAIVIAIFHILMYLCVDHPYYFKAKEKHFPYFKKTKKTYALSFRLPRSHMLVR